MSLWDSIFGNDATQDNQQTSNLASSSALTSEELQTSTTGSSTRQATTGLSTVNALDEETLATLRNLLGQAQGITAEPAADVSGLVDQAIGIGESAGVNNQAAIDAAINLATKNADAQVGDVNRRNALAGGTGLNSNVVGLSSIASGQINDQLASTVANLQLQKDQASLQTLGESLGVAERGGAVENQGLFQATELSTALADALKGGETTATQASTVDTNQLMLVLQELLKNQTTDTTGSQSSTGSTSGTSNPSGLSNLGDIASILSSFGG